MPASVQGECRDGDQGGYRQEAEHNVFVTGVSEAVERLRTDVLSQELYFEEEGCSAPRPHLRYE